LTEYYNANGGSPALDCIYYTDSGYTIPIRNSHDDGGNLYSSSVDPNPGSFDSPYVNSSAKGFRLPSSNEYEYAARYRGSDSVNAVLMSNLYWTKGDSASGATADYSNDASTFAVAVFSNYLSGIATGVTTTAVVKSKAANALGLYDMSGNAWEWCYDWIAAGSKRIQRGGCFFQDVTPVVVSVISGNYIYLANFNFGFRFVRNK
jgi:formylglycine-generating enzyme required for sulfatase activity